MKVYAYKAALICEECGRKERAKLRKSGRSKSDNSDLFPEGPYESDSNDSDSIHHCNMCGIFLEVPLTDIGTHRLHEMVAEALHEGKMSDSMREWVSFYDVNLNDMIEGLCPKEDKVDKVVKCGDLKDQSGPGPHPVLYCVHCGDEYSANKGDYFDTPEDEVMTCPTCEEPMQLVVKTTTFRQV